jgi:hypothetical protein
MPANLRKQIKIWTIAFDHLKKVSEAFKARGETRGMTMIASEAILQIPVPVNGNGANEEAATPSHP